MQFARAETAAGVTLRLLMIALSTVTAAGGGVAGPSRFYLVSESFSDLGGLSYYRVIDVSPKGKDSLVRYVRVAPHSVHCTGRIVQATTSVLQGKSPAELAGISNPCAVKPGDLAKVVRRHKKAGSVFEATSFGIVAQCGTSSVTLELPMAESVDLTRIKADRPDLALLWSLASQITDEVFGNRDVFHGRTETDDIALQRAGHELFPELVSGKYDAGLAAAVQGNAGAWPTPSFRSLLAGYRGPISTTEAKAELTPQLLNSQGYQFDVFVAPEYPRLALLARIQGRVELDLKVRPATGEVLSVSVWAGHSLLQASAVEAARQWRFVRNSISTETPRVTLEYALRCQ